MMKNLEQIDEEIIAMYMRQPKRKIAEMLMNCNKYVEAKEYVQEYSAQKVKEALEAAAERVGSKKINLNSAMYIQNANVKQNAYNKAIDLAKAAILKEE